MKMIKMVAAIIRNEDKFLLVKQAKGAAHEGLWAFPAGRVEDNESLEDALRREVKEETNLDISQIKFLEVVKVKDENMGIDAEVYVFECRHQRGNPKPESDVEEFKWVTIEEIEKFEMRPGMLRMIKKLKLLKNQK
jgi:8-oxo-dGTP diphosphatase